MGLISVPPPSTFNKTVSHRLTDVSIKKYNYLNKKMYVSIYGY